MRQGFVAAAFDYIKNKKRCQQKSVSIEKRTPAFASVRSRIVKSFFR